MPLPLLPPPSSATAADWLLPRRLKTELLKRCGVRASNIELRRFIDGAIPLAADPAPPLPTGDVVPPLLPLPKTSLNLLTSAEFTFSLA